MKVGILFGAGAECDFHLPSGAQYTRETMLRKDSELYEALKVFYEKRFIAGYIEKHVSQFLFDKSKSVGFRKVLADTARYLPETEKTVIQGLMQAENGFESVEFKQYAEKAYEYFIDKKSCDIKDELEQLQKHFHYFGSVEKYFSYIVSPKSHEPSFWRVVNYFWSAYFSLIFPIAKHSDLLSKRYEQRGKAFYDEVLEDLNAVSRKLFRPEFVAAYETGKCNYYSAIKNSPGRDNSFSFALTTNYTPFIMLSGIPECIYLAGKLSQFEWPHLLSVQDLANEETAISKSDFVFPFLMTQAPVKPIIAPVQIREYSKALQQLESADILFILGYSLCENDNHINAILRDFLLKSQDKKIIYFEYTDKVVEVEDSAIKRRLREQLKLTDDECIGKIKVIIHNGENPIEILQRGWDAV